MRFKTNIERKNWLKYNNKKPKDNKKEEEEKSLLELRSWEKDDYIPNPTASVYPYNYTPKFTKFGFLENQPDANQLLGVAGFGFPRQGINANFVGIKPLGKNPYFKGVIGGGVSKQVGNLNLGLSASSPIEGYTNEAGKFVKSKSKITPEIKLKYNFENGGPFNETYNLQRAIELGYTPDETGHMPSVDEETKMWLKSSDHETAWKEYLYGSLNRELGSNYNVRVNPEGYFGERQLQYIPKTYGGKVPNIPTWNYPSKGTPIYRDTTEIPSNKFPHGGYHSENIFEEPQLESNIEPVVESNIIPTPIKPYYNIQSLQDKDLEFYNKWQGHVEYDPVGLKLTADMFRNVDSLENAQKIENFNPEVAFKTQKETPHWSAATTSSLAMALMGANNVEEAKAKGFRPSAAHKTYIQDAIITDLENEQNKYNFYRAGKLDEETLNNLEIGELIFKGRYDKNPNKSSEGWKYNDFKTAAKENRNYASHSDIIVGKGEDENGKYIEVSGGNVGDTYLHKKKYYLDEVAQKYAGAMRFSEIARNQQLLSTEGPGMAELPTMPIQSIKDNVPTASRQNIMSLDDMLKAKRLKEEALMDKVFAPNIKTNY